MSSSHHARRARRPILVSLVVIALATAGDAGADGCFVDRGGSVIANIGRTAVSGRLAAAVQYGSWDTRPMIRIAEIDPAGVVEVGSWEAIWSVSDVELAASTAYVAADGRLVTLDLGNPTEPVELDAIDLIGAQHLAVDGSTAYIATTGAGGNGWFDVVDASDTAALEQRGKLYWDRPDPPKYAIDAADGVVVIADSLGVLVIDVTDPRFPVEAGRWQADQARDVTLVGRYAVVTLAGWADPGDPGVTVLDLANPAQPVAVGHWRAPSAVLSVAGYGQDVVAGTESDGLYRIGLDDPTGPRPVDHWDSLGRRVDAVAVAWPTIAAAGTDRGLTVLGLDRACLPPRRPSGRVGR